MNIILGMHFWKTVSIWNGKFLKSPVESYVVCRSIKHFCQSARPGIDMSSFPLRSLSSNPANAQFDWTSLFTPENKKKAIKLLENDRDTVALTFSQKKAAVLVPLCYDIHGRPSLLYNLRSHNLSKHKGEISFPGGTIDPEDNDDPITAALRETEEELGIPRSCVDIWTTLRGFPTVSTNLGVLPVVGFIQDRLDPSLLEINPDEVDHAFTVPIEFLCNSSNWADAAPPGKRFRDFKMPKYMNLSVVSKISGEVVDLWGLTSYITHLTLTALVPPAHYGRVVQHFPLASVRNAMDNPKDLAKL